jgi:AraC-like protein
MPTSSHLLRWSTEMLPERARFSAFREEFARLNLALDVIDHSGGRPRIDVTYLPLGAVGVCHLVATPADFIRHKHHLKNSRDQFGLNIVEAGPVQFANAGQEHVYDAGSACLIDRGRPLRVFGPGGASVRYVTVQAAALKSLVAQPEDLSGRPVRPGPALRLLDCYLRSLASLKEPPSSELASTIGVHLLDLVAATLGPTAEAANIVTRPWCEGSQAAGDPGGGGATLQRSRFRSGHCRWGARYVAAIRAKIAQGDWKAVHRAPCRMPA